MKPVTEKELEELSSTNPRIKYGRAKKLIALSQKNPELLYPQIDFFVKLLQSSNNILKWTTIDIIGNLSAVDEDKKIGKLLPRIFSFLNCGKLITANHAVYASSIIAHAQPKYSKRITKELLNVENYTYETGECKNIVLGKVILAFEKNFKNIEQKKEVIDFVKRHSDNSRAATKKKALQLLKRLNAAD